MTEAYDRHAWRPTNAPAGSVRTEDIWFANEGTGWAVNSNGQILRTDDGGDSWQEQAHRPAAFLQCITFAGVDAGWVGSLTPGESLLCTRDGGRSWRVVPNLPKDAPRLIAGIAAVDEATAYVAGTTWPGGRPAMVRTSDGGATWTSLDLGSTMAAVFDLHFATADEGWVVGALDAVQHPGRNATQGDFVPAVLRTVDGGRTWRNVLAEAMHDAFPRGEWARRIFVSDTRTLYVALENHHDGALLCSDDGGASWRRLRVNDKQRSSNLQGVGFIDRRLGWIGGWGDLSFLGGSASATSDGGLNWANAYGVGSRLNRFRFVGRRPRVGYASGDTVYKFCSKPVSPSRLADVAVERAARALECKGVATLAIEVPAGARLLTGLVFDRSGHTVWAMPAEPLPEPGRHSITWDFRDGDGAMVPQGVYIARVTIDQQSESWMVCKTA